ncbi:signal peptide peptidase SppA [Limoniibacter endophyticus]|uniref:Clp protease n=1 Tax=Limoniibacter endophyticus TaxID=1565040 RepID=A0A8J3GIV0_9HYPH|nr:signal peptide peptidase SppA [Limoniibacter endophyticus]GHC79951.1 Clp protease [Limoniibacter endophyticus]
MAFQVEEMIDRSRLRRKLSFWRIITLFVIAFMGVFVASSFGLFKDAGTALPHIAKIRIEGTILEDEDLIERLGKIAKSDTVKGLIVVIDSPGGTTVGGEAIFGELRTVAERKPVVAQLGTLAASAGYMIASAADHIVSRETSIVGSIGVLAQFPDVSELMAKLGIRWEAIKSSPLKAEPNPFTPTTDDERAMMRAMIMDSYDWFVDLVASRRPLTREEVLPLANGAVFTGRQALTNKLVDQLGGEREAIAWLHSKGVDETLQVIEWKPKESSLPLSLAPFAQASLNPQALGAILKQMGLDRFVLDGMVSVWHPDASFGGKSVR